MTQEFKQTNYKIGLGWNIASATSFRATSFRALKRTGLAELTIEPTQVMGFNQFYDDFNGTSARRMALALDHKFSDKAFAGIELTRRDLRVPLAFIDPIAIFDWQERSHTAYASSCRNLARHQRRVSVRSVRALAGPERSWTTSSACARSACPSPSA